MKKHQKLLRRNNTSGIGFVAGLAAGLIATGVMLFLSVTFGGVSLPEEFGSTITGLMPPSWFEYLHQAIGADAKHYLFYIILVGQCLVFALSGAIFNRRVNPGSKGLEWQQGSLLAFILWLFAGLVLLPAIGSGFFGANLNAGFATGMISLAVVGAVFGLSFVLFQRWITAHVPGEEKAGMQPSQALQKAASEADDDYGRISRRELVQRGIVLAGIGLLGVGLWKFITDGVSTSKVPVAQLLQNYKSKIMPPPTPNYGAITPVKFLSPEVTSNDQFYVVSKNLYADPTVSANGWRLVVYGQVEHVFSLTYDELLAQPMQTQYESMMCVSNEVGGPYMSNAQWEGVPLKDLLQRAGVKPGATKVVFYAADDYSDSIHLSKALEPTTLLAVRMNGATLPDGHGFPARMLVPGIYGMKHVKWLTRIEVVNTNYQGYWQQRGWSDDAPVRLTSRIDTPLDGSSVPANRVTYIAGVAFSGEKGISEVDVSTDMGRTWQRATLKKPLSDLTWVLWELPWKPAPGSYVVTVRAIDLEGNVQDPNVAPPLPNGSSGYHSITVSAS
ncbi:MAG TPA: molybdopterin-dependent oxidoreductase [Ktedonobacteraceae bacterium]|nr:molybdopterin-dependent oxidoreductase [Ktedonobacteraceae bacterium]